MIGRILGRQPVPDLDVANPPEAYRRGTYRHDREGFTADAQAPAGDLERLRRDSDICGLTQPASDPHSPEETR